jgi:stage II sporulation protein AA (anti-sigma F factor antagonist)
VPLTPFLTSSIAASRYVAPPLFACSWRPGGSGGAWVHVAGEMDLANTPELRRALRDAQLYARVVVVDLRKVTFIESSGVHIILDAAANVQPGNGRLILVRGPAQVDRALTLTSVSSQVLIVDFDPSEAPAFDLPPQPAVFAPGPEPQESGLVSRARDDEARYTRAR